MGGVKVCLHCLKYVISFALQVIKHADLLKCCFVRQGVLF